ncbi:ferritin-like domain-containing protein [Sediminibacterium roseum]|uniref:Ferritin-like domain-containing protein n=2 Tax=Sediminibacterium roseum TaxID=1978412 RepID=A0ABW9ZY35_9BACT|nr:ferritin-like domain-containing protein [Sediminibacterium roseum]
MLDKFFMDMLKDIYWAEKHLVETLPGMQRAATTDELQEAFEDHLLATQKHVSRLEKIFRKLGKEAQAKKCEAMAGLVEEAKSIIKETKDGTMTRDVALIIAAQKIEHYEIATYGSMVQLARTMDKEDIATILEQTLWEEEDTDQHLTQIAESSVNPKADLEGTEEEENGQETTMSSSAAAMS